MTNLLQPRDALWLPKGTAAALQRRLTPEPERELPSDPVEWAAESGVHLWSRQAEIARSVERNHRTYVPSCHQAGKTFLAALIGAKWIASAPPGERLLVTSAPSERQVRALLWRELGRAHYRHGLAGSIAGTQWHIGPMGSRTLVALGMKPPESNEIEQAMQRFQGYHAPQGVLVILDEATGIPSWLWTAVDTITGGEVDRVLAIGNPDDPSSEFAKRCDASTGSTRAAGQAYVTTLGAHVLPIDAYRTPNLSGEAIPEYLRKQLIARSTVERWKLQWGESNPLFVSKVRGLFPDRSTHNVISPALIRRAWQMEFPGLERGCFGLDVARSVHGDESALYRDRGGMIRRIDVWREPDSTSLTAHVLRATAHTAATPIAVDTDGVGGPVFDMVRRGLPDLGLAGRRAISFSAAGEPHDPRNFDTRRSEIWWTARQLLEKGLWDLDEDDAELAGQLMAPRWAPKMGVIHVETKKELAARGIDSPDRADAAIMAHFGSRMGQMRKMGAQNGHRPKRPPLVADLMERAL